MGQVICLDPRAGQRTGMYHVECAMWLLVLVLQSPESLVVFHSTCLLLNEGIVGLLPSGTGYKVFISSTDLEADHPDTSSLALALACRETLGNLFPSEELSFPHGRGSS